jgi:hypothetical protein
LALIQLYTTTTTCQEFSIISSLREGLKHPWLRRFIWLYALWNDFAFGFIIVEKIVTSDLAFFLPDCDCDCDPFITEHLFMVEVFSIFVFIALFVAILIALRATFYWVWGTAWKRWRIGRAGYWIWGPIEEEHICVDLEKGLKGTEGHQPASLPREAPNLFNRHLIRTQLQLNLLIR